MPTRHLLLGPALLLAAPLVAQKPAPFRLEAVSRNPTNAEESTTEAALGQRVGTRGLGRDILRLRFTGDLPEGRRALAFHLLSEALMALGVMIGGALLLKGHRTGAGIAAAAHAMVVYSTLNAAGYYLQRGAAGVCGAMVLLAILSALLVVLLLGRLSDRAASA